MAARLPYPADVPVTDVMEFIATDGTVWCAYVEAVPGSDPWPRHTPTRLPARHLRFESATESRAVRPVPAGAPFLPESRLRGLLERAVPLLPVAIVPAPPGDSWERARRAARSAAALLARGREILEGPAAIVADRAIGFVASLFGRPRARL